MSAVRVVCQGRTTNREGKEGLEFQRVNEEGRLTGEPFAFLKHKSTSGFSAGQMYDVEEVEAGRWNLNSKKWVGEFEDVAAVRSWQARDAAVGLSLRAKARERAEGHAKTQLDRITQDLRNVYAGLSPAQRLPFELWLLNEIRRSR